MLVMFVLISIFFYDLGYNESEKRKAQLKETTTSSGTPEETDIDAMNVQ
jgi:hypothetical protein